METTTWCTLYKSVAVEQEVLVLDWPIFSPDLSLKRSSGEFWSKNGTGAYLKDKQDKPEELN